MIKIEKLNPFGRMCISLGMLPSSYKESLTYEEQLLWLFKYLEETVIPTVNNNASATEELQNLYLQLKEYVDNYFENLDIQEEINNKLDEMAESGELEELILAYINSKAIIGFDTLADLKSSENLVDGSYAKTMGYHSANDNGECTYLITETTPLVYYETLDNGLYAVPVILNKTVNVKQFGAYGDNIHDDTNAIKNAINYVGDNGTVLLPNGNYLITNQILLNTGMTFKGTGRASIIVDENYEQLYPTYDECIIGNKDRTLNSYNVKNITIENLKIINNVEYTGHLGIIEFNGTENCTVKNCEIEFNNSNDTSHVWGIILLGANKNTLIDHVKIKNSSTEGSLGGCVWIRGAYPEGNTPSLNINVTNCYFESSAGDEITCIDDGINGCTTEANITNCTIIGTANTSLPDYLVSVITVGNDSHVVGRYSNCVIKGKCNNYAVELGESGYSDIEKVIASIDNSTIEVSSGKGIIARNLHYTVDNCTVKVTGGTQAVQGATVNNSNIIGQLNSCYVNGCYIKNENSYACETCRKIVNSVIECEGSGGIHFFGNTKDVLVANNNIKADTYGIYAQAYNGASIDKCCFVNNIIERIHNNSNSGTIGISAGTMTGASLVANNVISGTVNNEVSESYGFNYTLSLNASITSANNVEYRY